MTKKQEQVNIQIHERMASVETSVQTILSNHLPHIQEAIDKVDGKIEKKLASLDLKFWAIIILLISALVAIISSDFRSINSR